MRIGIAGCGYWGGNIIKAAMKVDGLTVAAIADPDVDALQRAASLLGGEVKTHTHYEYLLGYKIDGVIIATPPALHVEQAVAALERGKAVFLEKPPAMTLVDLDRLLAAAEGKTLVCDYVMVYNPLVGFVKGLLAEVPFTLLSTNTKWTNWGKRRADVTPWWSIAPHPISVLHHLFGDISVTNFAQSECSAMAHCDVAGALGSIFCSWHHPMKTRTIELVGVDKSIIIDDVTQKVYVMNHYPSMPMRSGNTSIPNIEYTEPLVNALTDFYVCSTTDAEPVAGVGMTEAVTRLMCGVG